MAKLRKMLGELSDPSVTALMRTIETQSKTTLAAWAADHVKAYALPIYEAAFPEDMRPSAAIIAVEDVLSGKKKLAEIKHVLKDAVQAAREAEGNPAAQAAARAVAAACAVMQTPTNALGFTFYLAAAAAYAEKGCSAAPEIYDRIASAELARALDSLKKAAVLDEKKPVSVKWNC